MRFGMLVALAAVSCLMPTVSAQVMEPEGACGAYRVVSDPAGDVEGPSESVAPTDLDGMDLTGLTIAPAEEGLTILVSLLRDPRLDPDWHFYIWVSFRDIGETTTPPTWTIQRDETYQEISSMYFQPNYDYPVMWNESSFSFLLPWEDLNAILGDQRELDMGPAQVSVSGPYNTALEPAPYAYGAGSEWEDRVSENPGPKGPLRCAAAVEPQRSTVAEGGKAPAVGLLLVFAAGATALMNLHSRFR